MRTALTINLTAALAPAAVSPVGALLALAVLMARDAIGRWAPAR